MSKGKKYIWVFSIIILLSVSVWIYFFKSNKKTIDWKTSKIEKGDITINVTATGSISALTTVQVGTQVSGIIAKLYADFNSIVKKGQIIALLDPEILMASEDEAKASVQKAKVQMNEMDLEFERTRKLFEQNVVSKSEYDISLSNYGNAQSILKSSEAQLRHATISRQYATIRAPISGVVISRDVDIGQTVVSSFNSPVLFTIANDLKKMQVYANVDEADIGQIKVKQKVNFTVDAYSGENFSGEVNQIRLQPIIVQNVVNYIVIIDVPNPELKLLPGLTANIIFKIKEHKNILKISTNALHFIPSDDYFQKNPITESLKSRITNSQHENLNTGSSTYIWIKKNESLIPEQITIGLMEGGYAEIFGNVKAGDEVVLRSNKDEKASETKNPFMPSFKPKEKKSS